LLFVDIFSAQNKIIIIINQTRIIRKRHRGNTKQLKEPRHPAKFGVFVGGSCLSRGIFCASEDTLMADNFAYKHFFQNLSQRFLSPAIYLSIETPYAIRILVIAAMKVHKKRDTSDE